MTVGLVGHYLGAKMGIGVFIDRLLDPLLAEMARQGVDVKVICSPNALRQTPALQRLKARSPRQMSVLPALDYAPIKRFAWIATQFTNYCQKEGIDQVVWLSNPMVLPWHPPSIAVLHDVNEWKAKEKYGSWLKTTLRAWMYLEASILWARKIVCVSQATTDDLCHFKPRSQVRLKVSTIPNGLDSPLSSLTPAPIPVPSAPFLLSVGRIDPEGKRLPEAVALVASLRNQSGEPWELHMTGGMNKSTQQAGEAFIDSTTSVPWVHYHGYTEDAALAAWYSHASAVVFLSDNEGFGSPVAEAASFGRRVIVNANNQATLGAGGHAVIPVSPQNPDGAAACVLTEINTNHRHAEGRCAQGGVIAPPKLYTYADAAISYAKEIRQLAMPYA
ncbi:MAG: glycosyltransferase family 4 protein [Phormidesmis sp.]